jgi:hypothetical protein
MSQDFSSNFHSDNRCHHGGALWDSFSPTSRPASRLLSQEDDPSALMVSEPPIGATDFL